MGDTQTRRKAFLRVGATMALLAFILQLVAFFTANWLVGKNIQLGLWKRYEGDKLDKYYQDDVTFTNVLIVIILLVISMLSMQAAYLLGKIGALKNVLKAIIAAVVFAGLGLVSGSMGTGLMVSNYIQKGIEHYFSDISGGLLERFGYSTWISFAADVCALASFISFLLSLHSRKDMHPKEPQPQGPDQRKMARIYVIIAALLHLDALLLGVVVVYMLEENGRYKNCNGSAICEGTVELSRKTVTAQLKGFHIMALSFILSMVAISNAIATVVAINFNVIALIIMCFGTGSFYIMSLYEFGTIHFQWINLSHWLGLVGMMIGLVVIIIHIVVFQFVYCKKDR